jgi:hypothetical protein
MNLYTEGCETTTIWTAYCCRFHALIYIHSHTQQQQQQRMGSNSKLNRAAGAVFLLYIRIRTGHISFVVFRPQGVLFLISHRVLSLSLSQCIILV